jgi:lipopolysaccharide transport system ATP-binding protein
MMDVQHAIRVENIGKLYHLGLTVDLARNFRETIQGLPRWLGGKAKRAIVSAPSGSRQGAAAEAGGATGGAQASAGRPERPDVLWALRNVSFNVEPGDVVGVIGRNGSGKSTLLKILSRVTWPTEGVAEIRGRIGSLLEVGTGFHLELTGRENVYLNGAILGMRKAEIDRKFDEIVEFSGVEQFLDTPVKRYSSGMRVRLAFAVSAHLEPEVLIIDEVLAVGDQEFQNKCLGKMQNVAGEGRTVLFVSHNMQTVRQLCNRGIVLNEGRVSYMGTAQEAVDVYLKESQPAQPVTEITPSMRYRQNPSLEIFRVRIVGADGQATSLIQVNENFSIALDYRIHDESQGYRIGIVFNSYDAVRLASSVCTQDRRPCLRGKRGVAYRMEARFVNPFMPGRYLFDLTVKNSAGEYVDAIKGLSFHVADVSATGMEKLVTGGYIHLPGNWGEPQVIENG